MTDTWVEDWYELKAARAALQEAARKAKAAGMTRQEIISEVQIEWAVQATRTPISIKEGYEREYRIQTGKG